MSATRCLCLRRSSDETQRHYVHAGDSSRVQEGVKNSIVKSELGSRYGDNASNSLLEKRAREKNAIINIGLTGASCDIFSDFIGSISQIELYDAWHIYISNHDSTEQLSNIFELKSKENFKQISSNDY